MCVVVITLNMSIIVFKSVKMTFNLENLKRDFYIRNGDEISKLNPDGNILFKEKDFKYTKNIHFEVPHIVPPEPSEWYPLANSYYPYGSYTDPIERVHHLLNTISSNTSFPKEDDENKCKDVPYSERDAQQLYLESNPLCFIILGKPGLNEEKLGRQLADYWQCVHIEPQLLIQQEIESGSRAGQCIEFNLRRGRSIGIDVILRLLKKRVNSETSKHRGFVISGLPLIPNKMYQEEPVTSESVIFTAKEIFEEVLNAAFEIGKPYLTPSEIEAAAQIESPKEDAEGDEIEEEPKSSKVKESKAEPIETPLDLGEDQDVCQTPEISIDYETQLDFLFNLLKQPFLIIFLISSPRDCIIRRKNTMFDIYSKSVIDLVTENTNKLLYNYFSHHPNIFTEIPHDSFETYFHNVELESNGLPHLVVLPENFPANIETQLDTFHYTAVSFLERRIMTHDPQYFLKVDARTSIRRMLHVVKARLNALPVQRVVIPERIVVDETSRQPEGDNLMNEITCEVQFERLKRIAIPYDTFKWTWSDWGSKCPVSLRFACLKKGDPNIAVHFLNKIFFLADEEAYLKFYRNPRPYLLNPCPKPTCRFFIFGQTASGKTSVAQCLGYLYNGKVLSTGVVQLEFIERKEKEFYAKIREEATAKAIILLDETRKIETEELEANRITAIKDWFGKVRDLIEKLERLKIERDRELQGETKFELSSFPMAMAKTQVSDLETDTSIAIRNCKDELESLNLPPMEIPEYGMLLRVKNKIFTFLPSVLKKKNVAKPANKNDPFVVSYVNKAISEAVFEGAALIEQNMIQLTLKAIKEAEDKVIEQGKSIGGWIVDGMHCELSVLKAVCSVYMPDEIILLRDTGEFEFLRNRHRTRGANRFRGFREFFMEIGKLDAAWRSPSQLSNVSYKNRLARHVVSELFDDPVLDGTTSSGDLVREENYHADLIKFNIKWPDIEEYLKSIGLEIIEIEVTDKSFQDLFKEIIKLVEDNYRICPSPLTDKDRAEEVQLVSPNVVSEIAVEGATTNAAPQPEGGEPPEIFRRYGDTYHYCPVTYSDLWVLWKGKEEFAVNFQDRVYLMSNEEDYEHFLLAPRDYISGKCPTKLPPPRICIIGAPSSGKSVFAQNLANNYGLAYISYESFIKEAFNIESEDTFETLKTKTLIPEEVTSYLLGNMLLPEFFYANLSSFWSEAPTKELGFVLDDFPKRPCDVDMMVKLKLIPDIVIEIIIDESKVKDVLVRERLDDWEQNLTSYLVQKENDFQEQLRMWEETRLKKFQELLEEKREERYAEKRRQKEEEEGNESEQQDAKTGSQVSFDSIADQQDIDEINRMLDINMPVLTQEPTETVDEMKTKLDTNITMHIDMEMNYLKILRSLFTIEAIPYDQIIIDEYDYEKNIRHMYCLTESFKYRNISHFESCYDVSFELAERLLSCGYYFHSKYGKVCPVEYQENKNPFIVYPSLERQFNIFPVIHRSYIYYIFGDKNLKKFKFNPLFYVNVSKIDYPIVPMKLAVTGPPKCGKTSLANRIGRDFCMKVISRGQAIRFVLHFLPFSNLAGNIEKVLRKGWEVTDEMVAKCIEAATIDGLGVTQARRVPVPDERFDYLCEFFKPVSKVPAFLNVVDIAGLVKGASEGQGLGNAFLSHISACDAIFHLCRAFEDDDVTHVEGEVNPVRDLDIICEELRLKDEDTLMKNLEKLEKTVGRATDKKLKAEYDSLAKIKQVLVEEKKHIRFADWDVKDIEILNKYLFLTSKPAIYLVNLSEKDYIKRKNKWLIKIKEWVDKNDPGSVIIPFSGAFEHKLVEEFEDAVLRKKYLEDNSTSSALDKIIVQGYKTLQLEYFFTAGTDEVKAWTIQKGTKAPQAAGRIHTDFEKGFIMAEVMKFNDFKEEGTEAACKAAGKYRQQGRNYVVEDGDIIFFKFNAGAGLQAKKK